MDRFDVINFNDLTGPGGGEWVKIGGGSFGVVFSGEYLGTQVAIKEVLPNTTYDVEKYFERECVLMKEARHPNIVQYIGLTKSPGPDGRIYIISEFVGGNLRSYIADKRKPFPMRLRVSFATDIARALAYLHARNCMHRDLKGENLLITANERIKVCDFGFARIAARNEDEMRRISYCGTDGYMSPEILMGVDFSLPSDIFSLGVIFCELTSRKLVDSETYKRQMPGFGLDSDEIREMASEGCPTRFIQLAIDCVDEDPSARPDMREIIKRLRDIEQEVVQNEKEKEAAYNVGSLRGSSINAVLGSKRKGGKENRATRPGGPPRLPSFNGEVKVGKSNLTPVRQGSEDSYTSGSSGDEMDEALAALEKVGITGDGDLLPQGTVKGGQGVPLDVSDQVAALTGTIKNGTFKVAGHGNPWWSEDDNDALPSLRASWLGPVANQNGAESTKGNDLTVKNPSSDDSEYSTSVVRPSKLNNGHAKLPSTMSQITTRGGKNETESTMTVRANDDSSSSTPNLSSEVDEAQAAWSSSTLQRKKDSPLANQVSPSAPQSFMTAHSSHRIGGHGHDPSLAMATIASSIHEPLPLFHRFTLVKNGTKRPSSLTAVAREAANGGSGNVANVGLGAGSLLPPAVMLSNALAKCWVCGKRIGWKPFLDCDDCPYKTHVGCGEAAEPTCQEMSIPPPSNLAVNSTNASRRGSSANGNGNDVSKHSSRATSPVRDAAAALGLAQAADRAARTASPAPDAKKDKKKDKKEKEREKAEKRKSSPPPPK